MNSRAEEMMKILDFLLENKSICISDDSLFSRNTLYMIRSFVKGKLKEFELTNDQKEAIISAFINGDDFFSCDTPILILKDERCIKYALSKSINNVDFIKLVSSDLEKYIVNAVLTENYILNENSPIFLRSHFEVAQNSIKLNCFSSNFIEWSLMNNDEINKLIVQTIDNNYLLTEDSAEFLRENKRIVMASIQKDKNTIYFASEEMQKDVDVFKYLLLNGYPLSSKDINRKTLDYFLDYDVLSYMFEKEKVYSDEDDEKYITRISKIYCDAINSTPTIKMFESVFNDNVEEKWIQYRKKHVDNFENLFGKICAELRNESDFAIALCNITFLEDMKKVLGGKYNILFDAMSNYFDIFHSETPDKLEHIQESKDVIAKLSATYVSMCKEAYKKEQLDYLYYKFIRPYFKLRTDHPFLNEKIIYIKKKNKFRELYMSKDKTILDFVVSILDTYDEYADSETILELVEEFIVYDYSTIEDIVQEPSHYEDYKKYEKAIKLIRRLNRGYIEYDGVEVINYKDIISYDELRCEYVYLGHEFDDCTLENCKKYKELSKIFKKIKKDIIMDGLSLIRIDDDINQVDLYGVSKDLPFNDEYFEFDRISNLNKFDFSDLILFCIKNSFNRNSFISDKSFDNVYRLLVDNGLIWLLLFSANANEVSYDIDLDYVSNLINSMPVIVDLANNFDIDITNFKEMVMANRISNCATKEAIAILGKDIIEKLYKYKDFASGDERQIITVAKELACQMVKRSSSTVPYISGEILNYRYCLYDSYDTEVLICGIDTQSCFKVTGNDNDFLHYCLLDKNGFVIKITDTFGNFIAKASGFRNGNSVFINQLRTVYDKSGNVYKGTNTYEKNDVIEVFKRACEDIFNTSRNNPEEIDKIDFVFATKSYCLRNYDSKFIISDNIVDEYPMDNVSEDWTNFISNTNNLEEADEYDTFETDYGCYSVICMASSKDIKDIKSEDIISKDVPAIYERKRNKIVVNSLADVSIRTKINRIRGIRSFFYNVDFDVLEDCLSSIVFVGDNWYIIYNDGNITDYCLFDFDDKAKIEFKATMQILEQFHFSNDADLVKTIQEQINVLVKKIN